jgi:hypothetical protein
MLITEIEAYAWIPKPDERKREPQVHVVIHGDGQLASGGPAILAVRFLEPGGLDTLIDNLLELRYMVWPKDKRAPGQTGAGEYTI